MRGAGMCADPARDVMGVCRALRGPGACRGSARDTLKRSTGAFAALCAGRVSPLH